MVPLSASAVASAIITSLPAGACGELPDVGRTTVLTTIFPRWKPVADSQSGMILVSLKGIGSAGVAWCDGSVSREMTNGDLKVVKREESRGSASDIGSSNGL